LGVQIVGVSFDETDALAAWAADEGFQYELWQDTDRTLALHFGAVDSSSDWAPDRISVLLDGDGRQILKYSVSAFGIGDHPADVLADCEALFGG
jgi:peroxiredoxin